ESDAYRSDVEGTITNPEAVVQVSGVRATKTGTNWIARGVPLVDGTNEITATAALGAEVAAASFTVVKGETPLEITITSPADETVTDQSQITVRGHVNLPG